MAHLWKLTLAYVIIKFFSILFSFKFFSSSSDLKKKKSVAHCPICLYAMFSMICKEGDEKGRNSHATNQYLNTKRPAPQQCRPVWLADRVWVYDTHVFFTTLCIFSTSSPHFSIVSTLKIQLSTALWKNGSTHVGWGNSDIKKNMGARHYF